MSGTILLILRLVLTAVLYAFLAMGLYLLWQDLRGKNHSPGLHQFPPLVMTRIGEGEEKKPYHFTNPEVTIGRDPLSDLHLADRTISAQHSRLTYHHGQWWVEDLRSTNGTFLNGEVVDEPLVITTGDELRCGQVVFKINVGEPEIETFEEVIES